MKKIVLSLLLTFLLTGSALATEFSLLLNDSSIQAITRVGFNENEFGQSVMGGRLLYNDDKDSLIGSVGIGVDGKPGNLDGLDVGAQIIGNFGRIDNYNLTAFGLGLLASYQPPPLQGLGLYGRAQYAPKLLSFIDARRLWETAVGVSYMVTPKATLQLEFQKIQIDLENAGKRNADESVRVGLQFYF